VFASVVGALHLSAGMASAEAPPCGTAALPNFWEALDSVCVQLTPDQLAAASTLPEAQELLGYCRAAQGARPEPGIAALASEQRVAKLGELATKLGVKPTSTGVPPQAAVSALEALAQKLAPDAQLQTGAGTDLLVAELQAQLCEDPALKHTLSNVCSPLPAKDTLIELRGRLLRDAVLLALTAAESDRVANAAEVRSLKLVAALVVAGLESVEPAHLARRMASAIPAGVSAGTLCNPALPELPIPHVPGDPVQLAARIVAALAEDGPELSHSTEHYARVVERVMRESGALAANAALTPERRATLEALVRAIREARILGEKLARAPRDIAQASALFVQWTSIVEGSMTLADNRSFELPPAWSTILSTLLSADLAGFAEGVAELSPHADLIPAAVVSDLAYAARFVAASGDEERKRVLRGYVLGLAPWTSAFLFDVNVGTIIVDPAELNGKFAGDLALGYNGELWGAVLRGKAYGYEYTEQGVSSTNTYRVGGDVEGWLAPGTATIKADLRLTAGYDRFDTDVATIDNSSNVFADQTSDTLRGGLSVGFRYTPGPNFALGAWGGGGAQMEIYNSLTVGGDGSVFVDDGNELTAQATGKFRMQFALWPRFLVGRLRSDLEWYKLSTTSLRQNVIEGTVTPATTEVSQLEVDSRAFIDLEFARFGGFVPGLNGGLTYLQVSGAGPTATSLMPVFALGIRREEF